MPISSASDVHNIERALTKMSEDFPEPGKAKLSNCVEAIEYYEEIERSVEDEEEQEEINAGYDHMYASNDENGDVGAAEPSCQTAESEVKFLKDWLILHLDLIQQQNDEILDKEKTILLLQKENEMLKERISCMEKGTPFQPTKLLNLKLPEFTEANFSEDMIQDSRPCEEDNKDSILDGINCDNNERCDFDLINFEETRISDSESQPEEKTIVDTNTYTLEETEGLKTENCLINDIGDNLKSELKCRALPEYTFQPQDSYNSELDPIKDLKMSIRRKRLCSNSSALSNNDSNEDKKGFRRFKKKMRRLTKDAEMVTSTEQYTTQVGDVLPGVQNDIDCSFNMKTSTLEVPRWRVKHYVSCYTMEGTENLDDEVYNKRHMRLENDERRRKRWDVQRIREQRIIEKLKQRQERVGSGPRSEEQEPLHSLWPKIEDIKFIEITSELPVSAFGCPVPKLTPSEFSLPWLNNPSILMPKKVNSRKSSSTRRKSSRR